ncbi:MAG: hypothetical protein MZV64_25930 [Ignavibacteriales bacterium]|nr:hypothetical protein [Ignavibacteriales bacterium]
MLCVTHLATIAARADNHLRIDKAAAGGRTVTRVERIAGRRPARGDSADAGRRPHGRPVAAARAGAARPARQRPPRGGCRRGGGYRRGRLPPRRARRARRTYGDEETQRGSRAPVHGVHPGVQGLHRGGAGAGARRQGVVRRGGRGVALAEARARGRQPRRGRPLPADELALAVAARDPQRGVPERGPQELLQGRDLARGGRHPARRRALLGVRGVPRGHRGVHRREPLRPGAQASASPSIPSRRASATTRSGSGRSWSWRAGSPRSRGTSSTSRP